MKPTIKTLRKTEEETKAALLTLLNELRPTKKPTLSQDNELVDGFVEETLYQLHELFASLYPRSLTYFKKEPSNDKN